MGYSENGSFLQDSGLGKGSEFRALLESKGVSIDADGARRIEQVKELITQARSTKAEYKVASKRDVTLFVTPTDAACSTVVEDNLDTIKKLAGAATIELRESVENLPGSVSALGTVYLDLSSAVDIESEKTRLSKELEKLSKAIQGGAGKLKNPKFIDKAPTAVVEGARKQLAETQAKHDEIARLLKSL